MRILAAVVLFLLVPCALARAEDEPPVVPHGDFRAALDALADGLGAFERPPADPGLYETHEETWKRYAKPRIKRMLSRLDRVDAPKHWEVEADAPALRVPDELWSPLVRQLASLYTELGSMRSRYAKVRLTARTAQRAWLRRFPGPEPIGRVPSRDALEDLDATILRYHARGEAVPLRLLSARNSVAAAVAREEAAERARKRAEYEHRKRQAFDAIDVEVAATHGALRADVDAIAAQQRAVRELVAAGQRIEETRLKALVEATPNTGGHLDDASKWLAEMAAGRIEARGFDDDRSARWGSLVRQQWMVRRTKLLAAVAKAVKAAEEAKEAGGGAGGG